MLPRIDIPTLLYGDMDVRSPLNVADDLHATIPRSRLVVIPGAGHLSNTEAAARFNAEIRDSSDRWSHDIGSAEAVGRN